jgi:hypothetical protein
MKEEAARPRKEGTNSHGQHSKTLDELFIQRHPPMSYAIGPGLDDDETIFRFSKTIKILPEILQLPFLKNQKSTNANR